MKVDKIFTNTKDALDYLSKNENKVIVIDEASISLTGKQTQGMSYFNVDLKKYLNKNNWMRQ